MINNKEKIKNVLELFILIHLYKDIQQHERILLVLIKLFKQVNFCFREIFMVNDSYINAKIVRN